MNNPFLRDVGEEMGRFHFLRLLLISAVVALCITQGFGRELMGFEKEESAFDLPYENSEKARELIEVTDYPDPGPNPRTRHLFSPPPPPRSN